MYECVDAWLYVCVCVNARVYVDMGVGGRV